MPSFYFQQLLQTGLNGIDQQGITAAVLHTAGVILVLSLLWSVYEAYGNGGDVRLLGVSAIQYLALGLVFLNYQTAFRAVNSMFNEVADGIYNLSGGVDAIKSWGNSLSQAWSTDPNWSSALWNMVTGGLSAAVAGLIALVGYLLLPFTYTLFTLFYALYGSILYVVGPLVLALIPSRSLGQLGRAYFVNLMVFQCWGLLYAVFQALMSALEITDPMQFSGSFLQAFAGSSQVIVMSVASVLLSIMIALIPLIASRIVRGDLGSTVITVVSGALTTGTLAAGLAIDGAAGMIAGRSAAPEGPPPTPPAPGGPGVRGDAATAAAGPRAVPPNPSAPMSPSLAGSQPPQPSSPEADSKATAIESPSARTSEATARESRPVGQLLSSDGTAHSGKQADGAACFQSGATGSSESRAALSSHPSGGYRGHSLRGFAAWQTGRLLGRTMRWAGMGKDS